MMIAEFFIAAPVIGAITMGGVASVPKEVRLQAMGLGASRWQTTWLVIREARVTLLSAIVAGFGAAISEVGAVMMVGGNLSVRRAQHDRDHDHRHHGTGAAGRVRAGHGLRLDPADARFRDHLRAHPDPAGHRRRWLQS